MSFPCSKSSWLSSLLSIKGSYFNTPKCDIICLHYPSNLIPSSFSPCSLFFSHHELSCYYLNRTLATCRYWIVFLYFFQVLSKCSLLNETYLDCPILNCTFLGTLSTSNSALLFSIVISSDSWASPFYSTSKVNCAVNLSYFATNNLSG